MLKEELKTRQLTLTGKKSELIERLESDDLGRISPRSILEEATELSKYTVAQLQEELRNRGLSPVGKKDELVARLAASPDPFAAAPSTANDETPKIRAQRTPSSTFSG